MTDVWNKIIKTTTIITMMIAMPIRVKPSVIFAGFLFPSRSLLKPWIRRVMPNVKQTIKPTIMISGEKINKITKMADLYKYIKNNSKAVNPVNKTLSTIQPAKIIRLLFLLFPSLTKRPPVTARAVMVTIINMNRANGPILYILPPS